MSFRSEEKKKKSQKEEERKDATTVTNSKAYKSALNYKVSRASYNTRFFLIQMSIPIASLFLLRASFVYIIYILLCAKDSQHSCLLSHDCNAPGRIDRNNTNFRA